MNAPSAMAEFAAQAAAKAKQAPVDAPAPVEDKPKAAPAALRVKGVDDDGTPALTYSGPSEDGSAEVQRGSGRQAASGASGASGGGGTRRERREAARKQGRGSRSVRRG